MLGKKPRKVYGCRGRAVGARREAVWVVIVIACIVAFVAMAGEARRDDDEGG
jgi:hypothetical protein